MTNSQIPNCPKCGGKMFDERNSDFWNGGKTKQGKAKPMFKCRDKDNCDGKIWNEQGATIPPADANGNGHAAAQSTLPLITWEEMKKQYGECVAAVCTNLAPFIEKKNVPITADSVVAMTRDLFAERNRRGC